MKTAIATTFFPLSDEIASQFFGSLSGQTYKKFDVVAVNDGFNASGFSKDLEGLKVIEIQPGRSPVENRVILINCLKRLKYDHIIFADFDDYFASNRVEVSLKYLDKYDVVVNDLNICDRRSMQRLYLSNRLQNMQRMTIKDIIDKNFFGLSNTAVQTKCIVELNEVPTVIAFDWYFFSRLLLARSTAIFTNETSTYYRQYDGNLAGISPNKKMSAQVRHAHYIAMEVIAPDIYAIPNIARQEQINTKSSKYPFWWE